MPPKKRRGTPSGQAHRGRVTVARADDSLIDRPAARPEYRGRRGAGSAQPLPEPSSRYTPPSRKITRFRPDSHKAVGAIVAVLGLAVAVINDAMLLGDTRDLLPGGHSELYLLLAFAVMGYSTWWFGWWDRAR